MWMMGRAPQTDPTALLALVKDALSPLEDRLVSQSDENRALAAELLSARREAEHAQRTAAILQQQLTWVLQLLQDVKIERSAFLSQLTNIALPVSAVMQQPAGMVPPPTVDLGDILAKLRDQPQPAAEAPQPTGSIFDDVGDDVARAWMVGQPKGA